MITEADSRILTRFFDSRTVNRGRAYAYQGAVIEALWSADGEVVEGVVKGSAAEPYKTSATLTKRPDGRLVAVSGNCTCPVGYDCKHVVALLVATRLRGILGTAPGSEPRILANVPIAAAWEESLGEWLPQKDVGTSLRSASIALQFDLVDHRSGHGFQRIRLRPVLPGKSGGWIRTGASWSNVHYLGHNWRRGGIDDDKIKLFSEIRALATLTDRHTSYYADEPVWLDDMPSRRIWDLLQEATNLGVPLIGSGRQAAPVTVIAGTSEVVLDITARSGRKGTKGAKGARGVKDARDAKGGGLEVRTRIDVGPTVVAPSPSSTLFVGDPVHGIVWWEGAVPPAGDTPPLFVAAITGSRTATRRAVLASAPVVVPEGEAVRFFSEYFPRLSRQVKVVSSDNSVVVPDVPDDAVILGIRHLDDHRVELTWSMGPPGTTWREPLGDAPSFPGSAVAETMDRIRSVVDDHDHARLLTQRSGRFDAVSLEGMDTVGFLTDVLPALEAIPHIVVERTGSAPEYRPATASPVVSLSGTGGTDRDWFDLTVHVTVGGEKVPFQDLFRALALKESHLILPSGTYFSLDHEDLQRLADLIAEARSLHQSNDDGISVSRYQASLWEDFQQLGVMTAQASAWEASVRALATSSGRAEQPLPSGLVGVLRPYQKVGFDWLVFLFELGLGGILADDMGLGKTLQAIALFCHVREKKLSDAPFLVVAPTSVVGNWVSECAKFAPGLRVEKIVSTAARRDESMEELAGRADVVITSYALFRMEYEAYEKVEWAGLILDEAQFAKNIHSHAYRRAKTLPTPCKVAMTGTPMENHLGELWSLLSITAPGLFPTTDRFTEYYRMPIERRGDPERLELLRRRVRPLLLRRTKEEVAVELPPKLEQVLALDLVPKHRRLYLTYLQRERQKILGLLDDVGKNRFEILKSLTILRQASLAMSLVDETHARVPSTKLDALDELLAEIVEDGHRVLVFSQFTRFLSMARDRAKAAGIAHCYLDGRTRKRTAVIDEFRSGRAPVFFISLKAGGFGLNLTEADYCIILDPWWNPATEAQAVDRTHRIGQTKRVMVYRLVAKETIEEKVMAMKAKKAALFASVIDGGGFQSGALSAADIRGLLD